MKKKAIIAFVATAIIYILLDRTGHLPSAFKMASAVPQAVDLSQAPTESVPQGKVDAAALPTTKLATLNAPPIRVKVIPWNAEMGWHFAVGGVQTTDGSLMAKHGVKIIQERMDDVEKMKAEQVLFAQNLASGQAHPSTGSHFVIIMGDGGAQYVASLNQLIDKNKLGDQYHAEIIGSVGYSRGEDACWGPSAWKDNPQAMKGGVMAAYLRDGDWNLGLFDLGNNSVKNNPDETTYDPDAMNWVATDDFMKAVESYVSGHTEERPVVKDGKLTGEKHTITTEGVCTWTPGDVALAKNKGGLVRLISTKENAYQMPAILVGIKAWDTHNAKLVQNMLAAAFEGSDQVKHFDAALSKAGQVSYNVYADQSPAYWVKYYKGVKERDKAGQIVELGGSTVSNLADNLVLFGIAGGAGIKSSVYNASYTGFGNIVKQQYPKLFPSFPAIETVVNTSYIEALSASLNPDVDKEADITTFNESVTPIDAASQVAKKDWSITFDTGKATFGPSADATLTDLYNQLLVGGGLAIQIEGHTDNVGNPDANLVLSQRRADAVKSWLEAKNAKLFPAERMNTIAFGDRKPKASNSSEAGRAQNRRVTIVLGVQ